MKHRIFTNLLANLIVGRKGIRVLFTCFLTIFLWNGNAFGQCPSDLNITFAGDSDNDVCQNGENLILTVIGNNIPNNPDYITWYGALSEGTDPGEITDYGLTGTFYAHGAPAASYTICADVGPPNCSITICENMVVIEEQIVDLDDAMVTCSISASGIFNLDGLIDGGSSSSNIYGGEWSLDSNVGGNIVANTLEYTSAGCYELTYDAPETVDNSCNADDETAYLLVTQQPQPNFDILDQICYVEGTNVNLTSLVNSPVYKFNGLIVNAIETWTSSDNSIATVNGAGVVTIKGPGTVQICLEETLNHASCGSNAALNCSEQFCQEIFVIPTPSDLEIILTDDICNNESDRNLTLTGSFIPTNPDQITWYGGLDEGTDPGDVSDDGLNGTFYSNDAPAGTYTICANVGHPECVVTICEDIIVVEEQIVVLVDGAVECSISASGIFSLDGLIDGGSSSSNIYGGVWTLAPNAGGSIVGNSLQYNAAGCYELTYDPPATLDDDCDESPKTTTLLVTQQPQPSFDIQDQVCWSVGDPPANHIYPSKINSPGYSPGVDLIRTWSISSGPATVDNNGNVTITGVGIVMVCMTETIAYDACGSNAASECEETFCQQISVSDGTAQDASFSFSDSEFCIGDVIILTATTPGGEFTGLDVVDDGNGMTGSYTITSCGSFPITYTLNNPNGCTASYTVNLVTDKEAPELTLPTSTNTAECGTNAVDATLAAWRASASATDNCPGVAVTSILFNTISNCSNTEEQVWEFTATDACGNTTIGYASFTIVDTTNPSIDTEAQDLTVECDGATNTAALTGWLNNQGGAEASDICSGITWSHDYGVNGNFLSNLCGATGAVTVTFTATDECGNASSTSATFTIEDTTKPAWSIAPINLTIECDGTTDPSGLIADWLSINGNGIAVDDCGSITYSNDYTEGDANTGGCSFWTGSTTVTFIATDDCDNFKNATAIVTIIDTAPPIVSCPPNIILNCNDPIPAAYTDYDAFVAAGGIVVDECSMTDDGDVFTVSLLSEVYNNKTICPDDGMYTITRTYIATDACGNTATCTQDIMYNEDLTPPSIDPEASDITVDCDSEGNATELSDWLNNHGGASATDDCSDVTWTYDLISSLDQCSNTVIDTYRFTVTDGCGNSSITEANFIIQDITPPALSGGENPTEECDDFGGNNDVELQAWLSSNGGLTATDACSDNINWSNDFDPITSFTAGCGSTGVYNVNFTATDDCGNSISQQQTFTIVDTTNPVFTNCPAPDVIVDAPAGWCASFANFSLPLATDNCSVPTVTQIDGTGLNSGSLFPVGTTILIWEAVDACGNSTTCFLKVIVNDYHTPPEIVCPSDVEVANDPLMCGAVVNDIALESVEDNCPDNLVITYTITDSNGDLLECGFEDASGFKFPVGTSTVEYSVQDQPLLLITEISQSGTTDQIEITNFGPADMDISCLVIQRVASNPAADETFIVPNGVIVASGETYIHDFTFDGGALMASCFTISYGNWVIDEVATNGAASCSDFTGTLASGDVYRTVVCDTDSSDDWAIIDACNMASIGTINPGLPTLPANSTLSSLQSEAPSVATCSFEVTVNDDEAPFCAKHDTLDYNVPGLPLVINGNTACTNVNVSITSSYIVGDVNITSLTGTYPDMGALRFKLISPSGTEILLFEGLCAGEADFDLGLDDDATNSVVDAPCGPLGFDQVYAPVGLLKDFFGENALGIWTLEITSNSADIGSLNNFVLEVNALEAYVPEDVVLPNDQGECGANYTWLHPLVGDNCCVGAIAVEYTSDDAECVPTGGLLDGQGGYYVTEFFCVGTTTVTYFLLDASGNTNTCSFEVTVEDQENPVAICPPDITINLDAGECEQAYSFIVTGTDNCGIVNSYSIPPSGTFFEIGTTEVTIFVEDEAGNVNSCMFNVTVQDYPDPDPSLVCNNLVNLSLDATCETCITADMILEGGSYNCYDNYIIEVLECHEPGCPPIASSPCVTIENIGQTLTVVVTDPITGNYCWGQVYIEDKLIPEVECPADTTIKCNASTDPSFTGEPILLSCEASVDIEYDDVYNDNGNCGDPRATIERIWTITDESGNSTGCVQMITIEPFDLADVTFPEDLDNFALPALECLEVQNDPSLTEVSNTGEPMINGQPLIQGGLCHYSTNVTDEIYDVCNNSYEILRTFKVRNMCLPLGPDNPLEHTQIIKVLDMIPPTIEGCLDGIQLLTTNNSCSAEFDPDVDGLIVSDACSGVANVSVSSSTGSFDLPMGISTITYTVTDYCGNIVTCDVEVEVIDATPPVPICLSSHVVGLTVDEPLYVGALVFDNGSFDNCELVGYKVRRMDNPNCPGNDATPFGDYVPFYCCDVNQNGDVVMVELQVTDAAGNTNSCMIEVEVQDKLNPAIQCPPNKVLDCYGDPYNLDVTGYATASDNCSAVVSHIDQGSIDNCGEGTIFRIWTATDPGGRTASCVQTIQVVNGNPFYISDNNCLNQDPNDGVIWPCDYETNTCDPGLTPDITGEPTIIEDGCDLIAMTYEDIFLPITYPACMKVLRTWIVIDWCQYNSTTGEGYWEYNQIIKVLNSDDPVIISDCQTAAFCSYDADCEFGDATLFLEATDDCTNGSDLNYYYWIDLNSNGFNEIHAESPDASGTYPLGTHTIRWDVEDGCGNVATCSYQFIITDCKAPTPILLNGIATELMENCTIEIWATDWDDPSSPSFDNCGIAEWLVQSPSQGPEQTVPPATAAPSWVFNSEGIQTVDIWILDVNGNWAYASTYVLVENNIGPDCSNPSGGFQIAGEISNEEAEMVEDVTVNLVGSVPGIPDNAITSEYGQFGFPNLPESANYVITPDKNINPLNGVSTFDLILITKHILNVQQLDSPYKIIAADINHSGTITAFDLVHLRRLILFIDQEFQENTSWRFVDAEFVFPNPSNPFGTPFPEIFSVNGLDQNEEADFIGVKIGDVNGSAIPNSLIGDGNTRNTVGDLEFRLADQEMIAGETYELAFKANDFNTVLGYQFTLNFDPEIIEFSSFSKGKLDELSENNFGFTMLEKGVITTSWNTSNPVSISNDEVLFRLKFHAKNTGKLSDVLSVNSRYTKAEAYNTNGLLNVSLRFQSVDGDIVKKDRFELYQNQPNPFKDETTIGFYLPIASTGTLTIYDVSGVEVKNFKSEFNAGYNEISINRSELAGFGVLYYRLATPNGSAVKTMTLIR